MLRELYKINLEVRMKELKITRRNPEKLALEKLMEIPLEKREYEACRKSKFNSEEWNPRGKHYSIKGLYNLQKTPGITLLFEDKVRMDLERYCVEKNPTTKVI